MYIPKINSVQDHETIFRFIRENPFAIVVCNTKDGIVATHTPVELEFTNDGSPILRTHIAKANTQWQFFTESTEVMVVFNGPHTYISSSWYDHVNVPTWNYIAVHVYGKPTILSREATIALLENLVNRHEKTSVHPFSMNQLSETYLDNHLKALVAFEIEIDKIEAKEKLSQNRNAHNFDLITEALEQRPDAQSDAIKNEMERIRKDLFE